jgi:hypothetical protein
MSEIRNITLAFACREKLERNADGEFYCHKCAHVIVDFRCQSAEALQQGIAQAGVRPICGIFKNSQLSEKFTRYAAAAAIAVTAASTAMCTTGDKKSSAQQLPIPETKKTTSIDPECKSTSIDFSFETDIILDSNSISYKLDFDSTVTFGFLTTPENDLLLEQYSPIEALKRDITQMESKTHQSGEGAH